MKATSKYRGVQLYHCKWKATIGHQGNKIYLGSFESEKDAARAYDMAAIELHERPRLNFPPEPTDKTRIPLTQGKFALVDERDYARLSAMGAWCYLDAGYAVRGETHPNGTYRMSYMHRVILDAPEGMEVDHINSDKLDNRRSNLRLATRAQNQANFGPISSSRSGIKGVSWSRVMQKWHARIRAEGRYIHLGYFDHPAEAAAAYDQAAIKYHGEFAWLNNIDPHEFDIEKYMRLVYATANKTSR